MKGILIGTIELYQKTLSPDHSWRRSRYPYGFCRHYPSCSEYTKLAIVNQGVARGVGLGLVRIVKCNPFVRPSVDLSYTKKNIGENQKGHSHG